MKSVDYFLGTGPHAATRIEHENGTVEIRMFNGTLVGHGSKAHEAASHLANQLRTLARFVERHEGAIEHAVPVVTQEARDRVQAVMLEDWDGRGGYLSAIVAAALGIEVSTPPHNDHVKGKSA